MKNTQILLISLFSTIFCGPSAFSSTYLNREDTELGITLGSGIAKGYEFVQAVGQVGITFLDKDHKVSGNASNGVLLTPEKCIFTRHVLEEGIPILGSIIFHSNPSEINAILSDSALSEEEQANKILQSDPLLKVKDTIANFILPSVQMHPTKDLAIVTLDRPLEKVPILPLILEKPLLPASGYLISFAPVAMHSKSPPEFIRHISSMTVKEMMVPRIYDNVHDLFLCQTYKVVEGPTSTAYSLEKEHSSLSALTNLGDSGAPLLTSKGNILGLNSGTYTYSLDKTTKESVMMVIPFYPVKDWLLSLEPAVKFIPGPSESLPVLKKITNFFAGLSL